MTSSWQTRQRSIGSTISSSVKAISHCSWLPLIVQRMLPHRSFNSRHNGLVIALGGEQARSAAIYEQSAGNPYFISELVRSTPHSVPTALADLLQARLERLPEVALQVLQAAAILLPDTDIPTLRRTSGRNEEETLGALENLFRAGLLREQGQQYAFVHPLVATIIVDHMSGIRRAALHRRVAAVLESMYAEEIPT